MSRGLEHCRHLFVRAKFGQKTLTVFLMAAISSSRSSLIFATVNHRFSDRSFTFFRRCYSLPRLSVSSRLLSSRPYLSGTNGSLEDPSPSSSDGDVLHAGFVLSPQSAGVPVFVALPANIVRPGDRMLVNRKALEVSLKALSLAGVEGIVVEFWWGMVEVDAPGVYDWRGFADLVTMASNHGLKVRAIMAFHQSGSGPDDPCWIPLPKWVLREMDIEPEIAYLDEFGRRNKDYISLICDNLPVLKGRSPIQAYSDFMRSFRDTFKDLIGIIITEVQVGMGPSGELRYPSCPSEKLICAQQGGELRCYDKYMFSSLRACAENIGVKLSDGSWNSDYRTFFLEWYSGLLLLHGERLCMAANAIFLHSGVKISAKVAGISRPHPSDFAAVAGYLPIAHLFSQYKLILYCSCIGGEDADKLNGSNSSPKGFLPQLVYAAGAHSVPLCGEISLASLDDRSLERVIKTSRPYFTGAAEASLSFTYVRMDRHLFDPSNWPRFTRFVRRMSNLRTFQAKLGFRGRDQCLSSVLAAEEVVTRSVVFC